MGTNKQYTGYRSYQYLEEDRDYKRFILAKEIGRVPSRQVALSPAEEQRVQALLAKNIAISMHDHPVVMPEDTIEIFEQKRRGRDFTGFAGLAASGLDCIFDNLMNGLCTITSQAGWKWTDVLHDLGMRLCDLAHQDFIIVCDGVQDIVAAHDTGRLALVPTLESATPIENELDRVDVLYGFGIRSMGITYSEANALGSGLLEARDGGLTELGRQVVRRMNKLGILIDAAHCGDQTTLDIIAVSEQPIVISHAGARSLWNTRRLKPDHVLEALADKGGVLGVEAAPHTTLTEQHPRHSIESCMEHFEHAVKLIGIDHVGFGPDTMFGDHVGLHHAYAALFSIAQVLGGMQYEEVEYVDGLENPADFPNIIRWLVKQKYSDEAIAKVVGGNALRVLKQVWVH
ncbi:MAG TPA: membrane dipeptidase [Candidatus Binatia bacterium]|nr:membrane dipeptidase [Candidatus Binatia bacterium]